MNRLQILVLLAWLAACEQEGPSPGRPGRPPAAATPQAQQACAALPARIRTAGDFLHAPVPDPERALAIYDDVLARAARGCTLTPRDEWSAREGTGIAHLMKGNWPRARVALEEAARKWPRSATTRYNLACALCRSGDLEGCHQELSAALEVAAAGDTPEFLADQARSREYFAELARSDPDLALLRVDPRFERLVGVAPPP